MYNLFLDDERLPKNVIWVNLPLVHWIIARNYNEFIRVITENGIPTRVSFDHDLAFEHYPGGIGIYEGDPRIKTIKLKYDSYRERTGYHACKWLIEYCLERKLSLPECFVHTLNPVGRQNIQSLLDSYKKMCDSTEK
jgi:hypothetical protein